MTDGKWQCRFPHPSEWVEGNVIGSGSFGIVHLAIDTATGSLFVVKSARSEAGIASLKNEAVILQGLNSPYIVRCMGKDVSDSKCNLMFEYMGGGSIWDVMQKFGGALQEKVIRLYTREILHGLNYLHDQGIVHSDIKCNNILVGTSGMLKLSDFGCATRQSCKGIGGTPLWMAPEVLRHEPLGSAADIWSLGCTVIEMATGRPPWGDHASLLDIVQGKVTPRYPKHFSAEAVDFLCRCLHRDPRMRWSSQELLDHPFVTGEEYSSSDCSVVSRMGDFASSPTSVFDVASYDSDCRSDDDDDEDDEFVRRIPFSMKLGLQQKKSHSKNAWENHSEASDDWITVRAR